MSVSVASGSHFFAISTRLSRHSCVVVGSKTCGNHVHCVPNVNIGIVRVTSVRLIAITFKKDVIVPSLLFNV